MGNVRFIKANDNKGRKAIPTAVYPKLINAAGGYTSPPALVQDAAFPMANALLPDRISQIWSTGPSPVSNSGGADIWFDIDLGSAQSISTAGVLGFSLIPGGAPFPASCQVFYASSYNGTFGSSPVPASFTLARDVGMIFTSPTSISARYWRFSFSNATSGNGFTLGSFYLGSSFTDLGFLYAGATETIIQPRSLVEGYGAAPTITRTGLTYRRFTFNYQNIEKTVRDTFDSLLAEPYPFVYIDPFDVPWEVVPDEEFARDHVWALPNLYTFNFGMRSLP